MPTPYESAQLNLRLFELRREPLLREARAWFLGAFHPTTFAECVALAGGPHNASFRMVLGYWDMAASLVTGGAVDADAFHAAHGEIVSAFALVAPFLDELRTATGEAGFCRHVEAVVLARPDAAAALARRRAQLHAAAARGIAATAATAATTAPPA